MNFAAKLYQRPLDLVDSLLDGITSYRLLLYFLLTVLGWATLASFRGNVPFSWHAIVFSALALVIVCRLSGEFFARVLNIARNFESDYITALILALIMSPATTLKGFAILVGAGFAAIASKYLLTIGRRHILNPAAAGAVVAGVFFGQYASWWVGTAVLAPLVLVGGLLIMRKMKRFYMVAGFALVYGVFLHHQFDGAPALHTIWLAASGTAVMFFAFIMLTEPLTLPDLAMRYMPYAVLVAVLYSVNRLRLAPEEALLIGNVFAYALERGKRLELSLNSVRKEAEGIYSFVFTYHGAFNFKPGQYMEWTLPLRHSDSRGNRRYLTLSSAPTENQLMFTVRLPRRASHFKKALAASKPGGKILASHLAGSFVLPGDDSKKLAFIAGGIGVTPFRSMIKYVVDSRQQRPISLLYAANHANEFAFTQLLKQAEPFGITTNYLDTSKRSLDQQAIVENLPDWRERHFYLSGPYGFVKSVRESLLDMGVSLRNIKSDYFPGYG
ncbi:MAG: FAD-dependent oxidoreductase [Candidatus Saccharimonadales bacterium]|jgi:ferredoxin-NADP reductase